MKQNIHSEVAQIFKLSQKKRDNLIHPACYQLLCWMLSSYQSNQHSIRFIYWRGWHCFFNRELSWPNEGEKLFSNSATSSAVADSCFNFCLKLWKVKSLWQIKLNCVFFKGLLVQRHVYTPSLYDNVFDLIKQCYHHCSQTVMSFTLELLLIKISTRGPAQTQKFMTTKKLKNRHGNSRGGMAHVLLA